MDNINLDIKNVMGDSNTGGPFLSMNDFESMEHQLTSILEEIKNEKEKNEKLSFLYLPNAYDPKYGNTPFGDVLQKAKTQIEEKAKMAREECSDYIQIGIGGSALGAIALNHALSHPEITAENGNKCRIHMPDNIDPDWLGDILDTINPEKTFLNVNSKSGDTVETISTFFVFYHALKQKIPAEKLKKQVIVMTNPLAGALSELSKEEGFPLIPIPNSVHGRFSVLSPSGLLTAAVSGIDMDELLEGARVMNELTDKPNLWENPALLYAAIHFIANTKKNIDSLILIPYSQKLGQIGDWYSQLVAESLGKDHKGITPVKALGVTDQHSQLQLYNEGPKNKLITFFALDKFKRNIEIPSEFPNCTPFKYLWGHSMNELMASEQSGTAISLYKHGAPNCTFHVPELSPFYMGQLFMLLEKVIPVLGKLYNVNAFNQPGVEESKEYARALLGKEGEKYDQIRQDVDAFLKR
ncbi:MAG: glucose-6-phosphate isomerase [Candidatus Omnitrophota bacterium]